MQDNGTADLIEYTPKVNLRRAMTVLWELLESDYPDIRLNAARTVLQASGMTGISVPSIPAPAQVAAPSPYPHAAQVALGLQDALLAQMDAAEAEEAAGNDADQLRQMVRYLRSVDPSDTRPGEAPADQLRRIVEFYRGSGNQRFEDED